MGRTATRGAEGATGGPRLTPMTALEAKAILRVKFAKADLDRMDQLLARSAAGTLSEIERGEMTVYLQWGNLLTVLHSKARVALKGEIPKPRRKSA